MPEPTGEAVFPFTALPPQINAATPARSFRTAAEQRGEPIRVDDVLRIEDESYPWFRIEPKSAGQKGVAAWKSYRERQAKEVEYYQISYRQFWNGIQVQYFEKGKQELKLKVGFTTERREVEKSAFAVKLGIRFNSEVKSATIKGGPQATIKTQFDSEFNRKLETEILSRNVSTYEETITVTKEFTQAGYRALWQKTHVLEISRKLRDSDHLDPVRELQVGESDLVWSPVAEPAPKSKSTTKGEM